MKCVDWARFGLPCPIEIGQDGFPRPGKVVRWYREQKKQTDATWIQKRLARELETTERSVCYLESHDVGCDSISLRRKLIALFNIPPALFGLVSLEDKINPGQTVKQHRKMKPKQHPLRSQKGLARALSITDKAVRDMENRNIGLDSITRRRILAMLLDIPPVALGIITLEELLPQQRAEPIMTRAVVYRKKEAVLDLAHYKEHLKAIWNRNHMNTAQDCMTQIAANMADLTSALPYANGDDEKEIRNIICYYHQIQAHILRDQGRYDIAIAELEKAAILAERAENPHLLAATLLRIGSVLRDRGDVTFAQAHLEAARGNSAGANQKRIQANADFLAAMDNYTKIHTLERIPLALKGVLLFDEGYALAHLAHRNQNSIRTAIARIEDGGKIIARSRGILEDEFSIRITEKTYHNTKAAAFLAVGWPAKPSRNSLI